MDDLLLPEAAFPFRLSWSFWARDDSIEEVLEAYPSLKKEDIYACIQFGATLMANHYHIKKIA